jgi:uncharacterized protein YydD (DUF2326 family)
MIIEFRIDKRRLTVDDLINIEEGKLRAVRDVMARFLIQDGQYPEEAAAVKIIGSLDLEIFEEAAEKFRAAMMAAKDEAIPKQTASGL